MERADRTFKPDEKMMIYVEPVGFGFGGSGAGKSASRRTLTIENMTGQVLGEAKDVFSISVDSAPDRHEFAMTLAFGVPYLRPGDYKAASRCTIRIPTRPAPSTCRSRSPRRCRRELMRPSPPGPQAASLAAIWATWRPCQRAASSSGRARLA